ncbi:MAG TPA: helix-turn-helix transcriptional regulator [Vicinamibacterales bacterium]
MRHMRSDAAGTHRVQLRPLRQLARLRQERGLSKRELVRRVRELLAPIGGRGASIRHFYRLERGDQSPRSIDLVNAIATVLEVDPADLSAMELQLEAGPMGVFRIVSRRDS